MTSQPQTEPDSPNPPFWALVLTPLVLIGLAVLTIVNTHLHAPGITLLLAASLLIIPGAFIQSFFGYTAPRPASRIIVAAALSIAAVCTVGGLASLFGKLSHIAHPLNTPAQYWIWAVLLGGAALASTLTKRDPLYAVVRSAPPYSGLISLLFIPLPVVAALGAAQVNAGHAATLSTIALVLAVVAPLLVAAVFWRKNTSFPISALLYASSLATLLVTTLRSNHLFGWDIQQEYGVGTQTIHAGIFSVPANHDAYASMLSLTALPAQIHSLTGLSLQLFLRLLVPAVLALLPVAAFALARSRPTWPVSTTPLARDGLALLLSVSLVLASAVYPAAMPSIARQSLALILVAAAAIALLLNASRRPAIIIAGILLASLSFVHYSTSYMMAGIILIAWAASFASTRIASDTSSKPTNEPSPRRVVLPLVFVTIIAAFAWNIGITHNNALSQPSGAFKAAGVALQGSVSAQNIPAPVYERQLNIFLADTAPWIQPVRGSSNYNIHTTSAPKMTGIAPASKIWWNRLVFLAHEAVLVFEGLTVLFCAWLWFKRRNDFNADLFGFALAAGTLGVLLRFSGTMAQFYNPERGALVSSLLILPAAAALASFAVARFSKWLVAPSILLATILVVSATGLSVPVTGGNPPAALWSKGENVERFAVSAPEFTTASWINSTIPDNAILQSDRYGQLAILNFPIHDRVLPELVPANVDKRAYVYASEPNTSLGRARGGLENGRYISVFGFPYSFFDKDFYVVYSTGSTRVYHR